MTKPLQEQFEEEKPMTWEEKLKQELELADSNMFRMGMSLGIEEIVNICTSFIKKTRKDAVREALEDVEKILRRHAEWTPTLGHSGDEEKGYQKGLIAMAKLIQYDVLSIIQKHKNV